MHWTSSTQQQNSNEVGLEQLPVMPQVLLQLLSACQKTTTTYTELASLVRQDPVFYSRILSVANAQGSLNNCQYEKLDNILAVLGFDSLRTIIITTAINFFFSSPDKQLLAAQSKYWQRALRCATTARILAQTLNYEHPEEAYLAGLLHNLGHILFCAKQPAEYTEMFLSSDSEREFLLFETEWVGKTSETAAAELLQRITADSFLPEALLLQHKTSDELQDTPLLIRILNLACTLIANDFTMASLRPETLTDFSLSNADIKQIILQSDQSIASLTGRLEAQSTDIHPSSNNESLTAKLGNQIKNFATLFALNQTPYPNGQSSSIWQSILQNLNLLFGLDHAVAFEFQKESNSLKGIASLSGSNPKLIKLSFRVESGRSIPAEALITGNCLDSDTYCNQKSRSTTDQQLIRFFGSDAVICLPIMIQDINFGVLVAGLSQQKLLALNAQKNELDSFSGASAHQLLRNQANSLCYQKALDTQRSDYLENVQRLAHEASNPLGIINNYIQVVCRNQDGDSKVTEQLQIIREEIERIAIIINQIKEADTSVNISAGLINMNQLVREQIEVFRETLFASNKVSCNLNLDDRITFVKINGQILRQILTNLLKNAVEAMPDGGKITLRTRNNINFNGKIYVEIVIADTGSGIAPEVLEKAFSPSNDTEFDSETLDQTLISKIKTDQEMRSNTNPGFSALDSNTSGKAVSDSTKEDKQHSGFGLSITSSLVTKLNGCISCRNRSERGAEFTILLPDLH
ncbi:HDOD domain-containing protein [Motiliproteus sp. MSK22-1]|uniref:HDOD domain-containing protein n=1 Tax=Motiliproteus sp. MSK22-1 TaxID=1897630 RepID=UPI000975496E|nr:HDOD domain-containing protein [Motiliproteus sp. MSK22-1]OMH32810.1 hypothetical protein BGP75_14910 [Motiliproteus sp. MSK22-1]